MKIKMVVSTQACSVKVQYSVCAPLSFFRFVDTDSGNNIGVNQRFIYIDTSFFPPGSVSVQCAYRVAHQTLKKHLKSDANFLLLTEELQMDTIVIAHKDPAVRLL